MFLFAPGYNPKRNTITHKKGWLRKVCLGLIQPVRKTLKTSENVVHTTKNRVETHRLEAEHVIWRLVGWQQQVKKYSFECDREEILNLRNKKNSGQKESELK